MIHADVMPLKLDEDEVVHEDSFSRVEYAIRDGRLIASCFSGSNPSHRVAFEGK